MRAPHTTRPNCGNDRRQLTPSGLSWPFSLSVSATVRPATPVRVASSPAGAFQTPRCASVRANTPATAPHGANVASRFSRSGSAARMRGKYSAALVRFVAGVIDGVDARPR